MRDFENASQGDGLLPVPSGDKTPALDGVVFSDTGLSLPDDYPFGSWQELVAGLRQQERSIMWWLGDALRFGERKYGEMYAQAVDATGYSVDTLRGAKYVAEQYPETVRRRTVLSFSHHREAAALDDRHEVLERAEKEGWSKNDLREHIRKRKTRGVTGTGENEWYTPTHLIEKARAVMGGIDVDPASNEAAQKEVRAGKFFTKDDDGLTKEWTGRVWMNPPYSKELIPHFCSKLLEELEAGRATDAITLTHNYTDNQWFHALAGRASAICFTKGRVKFYSPSGEIAAPTQGQAFCYFGSDVDGFVREFADVGFVVEVRR